MAVAELILSRREVLAAAGAVPALAAPLRRQGPSPPPSRHPELDSGPTFCFPAPQARWTPDQARGDESGEWHRALARVRAAEAAVAAVAGTADDAAFGRALDRLYRALRRLFQTPSPDVAALAAKLDFLVAHEVWELTFAAPSLAALRRDARRLARA